MWAIVEATLNQNDCTSSSFPFTLWPSLMVKVSQLGIILQISVVLNIETNQFLRVQMWAIVTARLCKSHLNSSLPWVLIMWTKLSMSFNKSTGCGNTINFIQINWSQCHPNWYNVELIYLYCHTHKKETGPLMFKHNLRLKGFLFLGFFF